MRFKNGDVIFETDKMPNCCGVSVMGSISLSKDKGENGYSELCNNFYNYILKRFGKSNNRETFTYNERVGSIIFTDIKGGEGYNFCREMKIRCVSRNKNPKTGNTVYTFILNLKPVK